jgi:hypothetical protein
MISEPTYHFNCVICQKKYTRKSSFDKHKILCEFKAKSKWEKKITNEEQDDIPTYTELVGIVHQLSIKLTKMEEKYVHLQQWVSRKKQKLDIVDWLNTNVKPTMLFADWIHHNFFVNIDHFETLMENSLFYTIQKVLEFNLNKASEYTYPIQCFTQKPNTFYIADHDPLAPAKWRKLELADMVLILKTFQNRMIKALTQWKAENSDKFDNSDKISVIYQKAIIKLMNISFCQDANLSRIKHNLYYYLKTDLKSENAEFEF